MYTIALSAIKGGVGKSSLAILLANLYAGLGKKVLVIDLDIQNSLTFYYAPSQDDLSHKNIAKALNDGNLLGNTVVIQPHLSLVPSHFSLINLRALNIRTLKSLLTTVSQQFDICVLDTAPTFDNIVLNALTAADSIITPAYLTQFDWKSALFYRDQLLLELGTTDTWHVLLNRFKEPRTDNPEAEINQYLDLFRGDLEPFILKSAIPDSSLLQKYIDTGIQLTATKQKEKLYLALCQLASEILGEDLPLPKKF